MTTPRQAKKTYQRILLKLSGEVLAGQKGFGIDHQKVLAIAKQVKALVVKKVQVSLVIGGGNILRGAKAEMDGMDRVSADYMGMLATVINALAMQDSLEKVGVQTRVQTAIEMNKIAEAYIRRKAVRHLEKGRVVIFAAGTGNPYFSTDTAATLRAIEINADVLLKATNVDGVYSADPKTNKHAQLYEKLSYMDVVKQQLKVMDTTAVTLCMENKLPIVVFNLEPEKNIQAAVFKQSIGTIIK